MNRQVVGFQEIDILKKSTEGPSLVIVEKSVVFRYFHRNTNYLQVLLLIFTVGVVKVLEVYTKYFLHYQFNF